MPLREWVRACHPQRLLIPMTTFCVKRKAWPSCFAQLSFFFFVSNFWTMFQVISWTKPHLAEGCYCLDERVNMAVAAHLQSRDMCMAQWATHIKQQETLVQNQDEDRGLPQGSWVNTEAFLNKTEEVRYCLFLVLAISPLAYICETVGA